MTCHSYPSKQWRQAVDWSQWTAHVERLMLAQALAGEEGKQEEEEEEEWLRLPYCRT